MPSILNIAGYKFLPLSDLRSVRARLQALCASWELKGTILLSPEGLNFFVAGSAQSVDSLLAELRNWPGLGDLQAKFSETDHQPFRRMLVRLKKEIIAFGVEGIDPARRTSPKLRPADLKKMLDAGDPITLLDTRNDYEVKLGTFANALPIGISHFRDFPAAVSKLSPELKDRPIVMFCTGGIRCEKAGPFMESQGFINVLQLDGGILKYFEECGAAHYNGECFVFDQRVGVDPALQETDSQQCMRCRAPLTKLDQEHEHYEPGQSCPECYRSPDEKMAASLARRQAQITRLANTLPGSEPHDHFKPVNIPAACDGQTLLAALCKAVPQVTPGTWEDRCTAGALLNAEDKPANAAQIVRSGQRFRHRVRSVVEPAVNLRVQLLHEDEALIVLNKPAPLPMHAGGRFFRNTLQHLLDEVYYPQKPRPSHRLDANTTGVVLVARTRHFASQIQPQFARGEVEKVYIVRAQGHPLPDEFTCDAPISAKAGPAGSRTIDLAGLPALTKFRVLDRDPDGTVLLEARPLTGRTNQIRLHLWHLGLPVCGDQTYLPDQVIGQTQTLDVGAEPLCLHALEISFAHPLDQRLVNFKAPLPDWALAPRRKLDITAAIPANSKRHCSVGD